jgi:Na+-driven multidrug efflux pump
MSAKSKETLLLNKINKSSSKDKGKFNNNENNNNNKLIDNFEKSIHNDMNPKEVLRLLITNSSLAVYSKIVVKSFDIITLSFVGFLKGNFLQPYYIAGFIQNVIFKGIGYGLTRTANMYASRYFGERRFMDIGITYNHGRICTFLFFLITLLFSIFGGPLISLIFSNVDDSLITTYLIHNSPSIFLNFQVVLFVSYLNAQNHYIAPPIFETLTAITQYIIFLIMFNIYDVKDMDVSGNLILTAWCLNITTLLQFLYYLAFILIYKPSPESNICLSLKSFKGIGTYLYHSIDFVFFFLTHFLGNEQSSLFINWYYTSSTKEFNAYNSAMELFYLIQMISLGFSFVIASFTGNLVTKGYRKLLKIFTRFYFIYSYAIIIIAVIILESFADLITPFLTDKEELIQLIPGYIRIVLICAIPYHIELSLQSIVSGYKKQKVLAYLSIAVIIVCGFLTGYIFVFAMDLAIYGVLISKFISEVVLTALSLYFYIKIK